MQATLEKSAFSVGSNSSQKSGKTWLGLNLTIDPRFRVDSNDRLKIRLLDPKARGWKLLDLIPTLFGKWLGMREAEDLFSAIAQDRREVGFFQKVVDAFDLKVEYPKTALKNIPKTGPLLIVANHPLHGVDGMAIAHIVGQARNDVKIMLTSSFDGIPGVAEHGIFVSEGNGPSAKNRSESTREAIDWLQQGHVVILFPAGQGSFLSSSNHKDPVDGPWQKGTSLLIRKSKAKVLPVFVQGGPSKLFQKVRMFFRLASMFFLIKELVRQKGSRVILSVGEPISFDEVKEKGTAEEQNQFLRERTYALDLSNQTTPKQTHPGKKSVIPSIQGV